MELVTGGAGFIGSHLVDALVAQGKRVRVLDNFSSGREEFLAHHGEQVEVVRADLLDLDATKTAMEGVETAVLDAEFGLREKGYSSLLVVPLVWSTSATSSDRGRGTGGSKKEAESQAASAALAKLAQK